jgi:hypothetical protein
MTVMSVANSVVDLPDVAGHGHCCSNDVAIFACEKPASPVSSLLRTDASNVGRIRAVKGQVDGLFTHARQTSLARVRKTVEAPITMRASGVIKRKPHPYLIILTLSGGYLTGLY